MVFPLLRSAVVDRHRKLIGSPFRPANLDQSSQPARLRAGTAWRRTTAYFQLDDPYRDAMWLAVNDATQPCANGTIKNYPRHLLMNTRHPPRDSPIPINHIRSSPRHPRGLSSANSKPRRDLLLSAPAPPRQPAPIRRPAIAPRRPSSCVYFLRSALAKDGLATTPLHQLLHRRQPRPPFPSGDKASKWLDGYWKRPARRVQSRSRGALPRGKLMKRLKGDTFRALCSAFQTLSTAQYPKSVWRDSVGSDKSGRPLHGVYVDSRREFGHHSRGSPPIARFAVCPICHFNDRVFNFQGGCGGRPVVCARSAAQGGGERRGCRILCADGITKTIARGRILLRRERSVEVDAFRFNTYAVLGLCALRAWARRNWGLLLVA